MIDPIRGTIGAFDISCTACGIVIRIENSLYGQLFMRLRTIGWKILAGRHYCPQCRESEAA